MRISKIHIKNYRLLEDFVLSPDKNSDFMLCIGRNNVGKTSVLTILDECLNNEMKGVAFDDITLKQRNQLIEVLDEYCSGAKSKEDTCLLLSTVAPELSITIDYSDPASDLSLIPMLSLDDTSQTVTIQLKKLLDPKKLEELAKEFNDGTEQYGNSLNNFLEKRWPSYLTVECAAISGDIVVDYNPLDKTHGRFFGISNVIKLHTIKAKRGVANDPDQYEQSATLSKYVHTYLGSDRDNTDQLKELHKEIAATDEVLTEKYNDSESGIFKRVIDDVKEFIPGEDEQKLFIRSMISDKSLLGYGNTRVFYGDDGERLPEGHSGLGYMNMYAIIIKLRTIIEKIAQNKEPVIANILFIEEPEAHTHPHMQYVFANKIKDFLKKQNVDNLLTITTTHSSHIISQFSDTDDIVFLHKTEDSVNPVYIRETYSGKTHEAFLKQYLTVHRAELFFADKIIFVEGDTERILMPYFIDLYDKRNGTNLTSQYVSIIDVGNYMYIFDDFIKLLDVPTLMITDLDTCGGDGKKCAPSGAISTSNSTIKHYLGSEDISSIKTKTFSQKRFTSSDEGFVISDNGLLQLTYQSEEDSYLARSFEDAFMSVNKQWIIDNQDNFHASLKNTFTDSSVIDYRADQFIKSKAMFAIDIINAGSNDTQGEAIRIPKYIEEGLEWIAKN